MYLRSACSVADVLSCFLCLWRALEAQAVRGHCRIREDIVRHTHRMRHICCIVRFAMPSMFTRLQFPREVTRGRDAHAFVRFCGTAPTDPRPSADAVLTNRQPLRRRPRMKYGSSNDHVLSFSPGRLGPIAGCVTGSRRSRPALYLGHPANVLSCR
jgi:hypothetical protein